MVGGWSADQFAEKRLPTVAELNAAAPDTAVLVLHLYQAAIMNRAAPWRVSGASSPAACERRGELSPSGDVPDLTAIDPQTGCF